MEVVQSCFGTRNVLEFSFDKCRSCAMIVLRRSENAIFVVVEFVQACCSTKNDHKYNFHDCRGCKMVDGTQKIQ